MIRIYYEGLPQLIYGAGLILKFILETASN